jgi:ribonuclease HII
MTRLDALYSGYGFARHMGYGTKEHLRALAEKGPCRLHRVTFRGVKPREMTAVALKLP